MILDILLLAVIAIVAFCPDTLIGRVLKQRLVDAPARVLAALTPRKALFGAMVFIALLALACVYPPDLALFAAVDAATYVELLAAVSLIAASIRIRGVLGALRRAMTRAARWAARAASPGIAGGGGVRRGARTVRSVARRLVESGEGDGGEPAPAWA